jgi:hypothetical protein
MVNTYVFEDYPIKLADTNKMENLNCEQLLDYSQ